MFFTEDLSAFFDTNEFAELVTYDSTPNVAMIFDNAFFEDALGRIGVESAQPAVLARDVDVPSPHGKTIVRGAESFKIVNAHPDGTGLTVLVLEKQ